MRIVLEPAQYARPVAIAAVLGCCFAASPARSALLHFDVRSSFRIVSPDFSRNGNLGTIGEAIVEDDGGGAPLLKKLLYVDDRTQTIVSPSTSGFIWLSTRRELGPAEDQTGVGSVAAGIDWGTLEGWTVSGSTFCRSVPASFCDQALAEDNETVPPIALASVRYDVGRWEFHATGFVGDPFVISTLSEGGQRLESPRGRRLSASIPAVPLVGVTGLVGALVAAGVVAFRRRRN